MAFRHRAMLVATILFVLVLGLPLPALAAQPVDPPAPTPPAGDSVPNEVLIQWKAGVTDADKARARSRAGAVRQEVVVASRQTGKGELELAKLPPGQAVANAVRGLQGDPAVDFAERNWTYHHQATSNDPKYTDGSLWGMYGDATSPANQYGSQAGEAWATGHTGSSSVYVGVIDEGIQFEHPDLKANVWTNPFDAADGVDNDGNGYVDDVHGWDFDGNNNTIYDGGTRGNSTTTVRTSQAPSAPTVTTGWASSG